MGDQKTATRLRLLASDCSILTRTILLHLAAVEEELKEKLEAMARHDMPEAAASRKIDELRESLKHANEFGRHVMTARAAEAASIAADALRFGLEECERLRAERDEAQRERYDLAQLVGKALVEINASRRDREKVAEWWEVRDADGDLSSVLYRRADAKRVAARVVHVTRWRKKR